MEERENKKVEEREREEGEEEGRMGELREERERLWGRQANIPRHNTRVSRCELSKGYFRLFLWRAT